MGIKRKYSLQLFTFEHEVMDSHSFLVAAHKGGMTTSMAIFELDEEESTLADLRLLIETKKDRGMVRRTLLFSEILQTVAGSVNWHNYPRDIALFAYQFGILNDTDDHAAPSVVPIEDEVLPVGDVVPLGDPTKLPVIVVVPVSQVCPVRRQCFKDVFGAGQVALDHQDKDGRTSSTGNKEDVEEFYNFIRSHAVSK
eukprot:g1318.t1